ncbi:hypothetical protein H8N03_03915 [Ramlibacter sp. USB13]|uniref:Uncharacterized protein n=1 Tax=Ramlibacter cellulosilyticus TaxID=2764187 RepID=A0A923MQP1_9BURK|nr:hypothetical protein [Ramlibacter cellulosilyticus]MBC5782077.1 hypothetical protein [Ramlibacter cellulosilyticus]
MPEMQPSMQPANPMPLSVDAMPVDDDFGYALGCECADPSLQIERWQEVRAGGEAN